MPPAIPCLAPSAFHHHTAMAITPCQAKRFYRSTPAPWPDFAVMFVCISGCAGLSRAWDGALDRMRSAPKPLAASGTLNFAPTSPKRNFVTETQRAESQRGVWDLRGTCSVLAVIRLTLAARGHSAAVQHQAELCPVASCSRAAMTNGAVDAAKGEHAWSCCTDPGIHAWAQKQEFFWKADSAPPIFSSLFTF